MSTELQKQSNNFKIFVPDKQPLLTSNAIGNVFDYPAVKRSGQKKFSRNLLQDVPQPNGPSLFSSLNFSPNVAFVLKGPSPESRMRSRLGMQSQASFFIRHNPHPSRVRHIEGLNGMPVCAVHDHGYVTLPRIGVIDSPAREYKYSKMYGSTFQNYPFKEKAVPRIGLIPVTNNWRSELRELCERAGLITDGLPQSPRPETPPGSPTGRKSVYSGQTGRLIPPPSRATSRQSSRHSSVARENYTHITPYPDTETLMIEMLCQILQTDSIQAVQQWLVSAGDREKALVLDLISTAMNTEEVTLENPPEEQHILSASPLQPVSRLEERSEEIEQLKERRPTASRGHRIRRISVTVQSNRSASPARRRKKTTSQTRPSTQGTLKLRKGTPSLHRQDAMPKIDENLQNKVKSDD